MPLFGLGRQADAPAPAPLTREERDERERKASLAEARVIAAHERAIEDDLKARVRAAAEPVPVQDVRKALLAALDDAVDHGASTLRAHLDELALGYEYDLTIVEYQRQADALRRAASNFRPTPPLTAKECDKAAEALRAEVSTTVAALVRHADEARTLATTRAARWLSEWARMARRIPDDEKLADARDDAALNAAIADARPARDVTHDTEEALDITTGKTRTIHTFRYPVPRGED